MKIDREEKRSLKKLLVGILVAAMVITMLPVGDTGKMEIKAAEETLGSALQTGLLENAVIVEVETKDEFLMAFNNGEIDYSNGIIIKLKQSIDLGGEGYTLPRCPVGIDMDTYGITSSGGIYFYEQNSLEMNEGYDVNLFVLGAKDNLFEFQGYPEDGMPESLYIYNGTQVVFSNVKVENVKIEAESGSVFGYNEYYYELPEVTTDTSPQWRLYFQDDIGLFRQKIEYIEGVTQDMSSVVTLYVDDLYFEEGYTDVYNVKDVVIVGGDTQEPEIYVYSQAAAEAIPVSTVEYDNNLFVEEYTKPEGAFIVDSRYGMYTLSDDGKIMTIYAASAESGDDTYTSVSDYKYMNWQEKTGDIYLSILGNYVSTIEGEDGITEVQCEKVIYAEGSIPEVQVVYTEDGMEYREDEIVQTIISNASGELLNTIDFEFHMSNRKSFNIFNQMKCAVNVIDSDDDEMQTKVWVRLDSILYDSDEIIISEIVREGDGYNSGDYVEAGSKILLSPVNSDMTMSGIQFGSFYYVENETEPEKSFYAYDDGRRVSQDEITYFSNGSVELTVPSFSASLEVPVVSLDALSDYEIDGNILYKDEKDSSTGTCLGGIFALNLPTGYESCEVDSIAEEDNWLEGSIPVEEEGLSITKEYYVIDKRMVADEMDTDGDMDVSELIPCDTYGKRSKLSFTYNMDTATPTITSVTATDANGNVVSLDGGWLANDENASVSAEMVWLSSPSITLKATADPGNGLPVAEYKFVRAAGDDADGEWQTSNTYTYTGDGTYDVIIHAKDQFDLKIESVIGTRDEAGMWVTTFGLDTTAPKLMFTDEKNSTASELKSDAQYEGNLHMVCDDGEEGSGFAEINLYKQNGSEWVLSNELLIASEAGSFITPTTKNEVYKIEVTDIAGNKTVYENITVLGYTQDVAVTVGGVTGTYGEALEVEVTVKNTSKNPLNISLFALREDATDDVVEMNGEAVTELAAGQSFTTKLVLPKGTNAGSYDAMIDMEYTNMDENAGQRITKVYSHQIVATINKVEGKGSITVEDITYGETVNAKVSSDTHNAEDITVYYKKADAEDSAYTTEVPVNAGTYKAKAVLKETVNYKEAAVETEFTIAKAEGKGTVTVENITYGEKVNVTVSSDTHSSEDITVYYKKADAEESAYTTEVPVNAGTYKAKAVLKETVNYKEAVVETEFTIAKATGAGSVTVEDIYYGQSVATTVLSDTHGTENVTVYYKRAEEDDSAYTTTLPKWTGTYKVKAVFAATENYNELAVEDEFVITRISETRGMYSISVPNEDGFYEGPVVIMGRDGNLLSVSEQGTFREQIILNGSIEFFRFFIKTPDGAITEAVILRNIVIVEPPVKVIAGKTHLDSGEAYELGSGTWKVSGDSTNYAGGIVFYVPASGDYEFTQQGGGQ